MIAASPFIGCGADTSGPVGGGGAGNPSAGASGAGAGGSPSGAGGGSAIAGGGSSARAGSPGSAGAPVATAGQSGAGAPAAGGAATAGAGGAFDPNDPASPVGNVSQFPLGSFKIAGSIYFIGHDAGGLYAMSMQCTHKFCAVEMQGKDLYCPCHFSKFDYAGNVLVGPATTPLPHYKLTVDASGNIIVDRFTVVSQSTRTKV